MLYAADFRARARMSLSGKWMMAVLAGLIFSLLTGGGPKVNFHVNGGHPEASFDLYGQPILSTADYHSGFLAVLALHLAAVVLIAILLGILFGVIGSTVSVGYARYNLDLTDGLETNLGTLFSGFPERMKTAFCAHFLRGLFTMLGTILFIIPGVIIGLNYAMMDYILAERPDLTAGEAMAASKVLMYGNRWRLFCLQFSFIGWSILSAFTFGIGELFLRPYRQASYAAFYRSLQ